MSKKQLQMVFETIVTPNGSWLIVSSADSELSNLQIVDLGLQDNRSYLNRVTEDYALWCGEGHVEDEGFKPETDGHSYWEDVSSNFGPAGEARVAQELTITSMKTRSTNVECFPPKGNKDWFRLVAEESYYH